MADNTVFDTVFKTMVTKIPRLVVPLVNEAFGRDYPPDEPVERIGDVHETPRGERLSDSAFRLRGRLYHVECQSTPDSNMVVRMIEYDFAIALERALAAGEPYEIDFPESCVLFLRHTAATPDVLKMRVNMPGGGSLDYKVKVMKVKRIGVDELFEKRLLLLLPYHLMRYEHELAQIAFSAERAKALVEECASLRERLEAETAGKGDAALYDEMTRLIIRVDDYLLAAYEGLRREARKAMGGEVLELLSERAERLEREGLERGLARGLEQGLEQGLAGITAKLRESGVDEALLESAAAAVRAEHR